MAWQSELEVNSTIGGQFALALDRSTMLAEIHQRRRDVLNIRVV